MPVLHVLVSRRVRRFAPTHFLAGLLGLVALSCHDDPIRLQESANIIGTVTAEGRPVSSLTVTLDDRTTRTDAVGSFAFEGIPLGSHVLTVDDADGDLVVEHPTATVSLTQPGQTVTVPFTGQWLRESSVELFLEPPFAALSVGFFGPDTFHVTAAQAPANRCHFLGCRANAGYAFRSGLRAGHYDARLATQNDLNHLVVRSRMSFDVRRGDTASVTLVVAPATLDLTAGDTVGGTSKVSPAGYRILVPPGDTVDLRFTQVLPEYPSQYESVYERRLYTPSGDTVPARLTVRDVRAIRSPVEYWRLTGADSGSYTLTVEVRGDLRGSPPPWYGIATRASGPMVRVAQSTSFDRPALPSTDTVYLWNAGAGRPRWRISQENDRLSLSPSQGELAPAGESVPEGGVPQGAQAVVVTADLRGLRGYQRFEERLTLEGTDEAWVPLPEFGVNYRVYDERVTRLLPLPWLGWPRDVDVDRDGSVYVADRTYIGKLIDGGLGATPILTEVGGSEVDPAGFGFAPDGSLFVQHGCCDRYEIWRIGTDGTKRRLLSASYPETGYLIDLVPVSGDRVFLTSAKGFWELSDGGGLKAVPLPTGVVPRRMAYDRARERVVLVDGSPDADRLYAYSWHDQTTTLLGEAPGPYGTIDEVAVGRSGVIYSMGRLPDPYSVSTFDPSKGTWGEALIGPYGAHRIAIAEGRLLFLVSPYGPPQIPALAELPIDDGPWIQGP